MSAATRLYLNRIFFFFFFFLFQPAFVKEKKKKKGQNYHTAVLIHENAMESGGEK